MQNLHGISKLNKETNTIFSNKLQIKYKYYWLTITLIKAPIYGALIYKLKFKIFTLIQVKNIIYRNIKNIANFLISNLMLLIPKYWVIGYYFNKKSLTVVKYCANIIHNIWINKQKIDEQGE